MRGGRGGRGKRRAALGLEGGQRVLVMSLFSGEHLN